MQQRNAAPCQGLAQKGGSLARVAAVGISRSAGLAMLSTRWLCPRGRLQPRQKGRALANEAGLDWLATPVDEVLMDMRGVVARLSA